jgi:hypothetical protein
LRVAAAVSVPLIVIVYGTRFANGSYRLCRTWRHRYRRLHCTDRAYTVYLFFGGLYQLFRFSPGG